MTTREAPLLFLRQLATGASGGWADLGRTVFSGELSFATGNSEYRVRHGVLATRAKKPARSFEIPASMHGLLLVGFLVEDDANDRWALGTVWQPGAHAVLWRPGPLDTRSFVITSPTLSFAHEPFAAAEPEPSPWVASGVPQSGIVKLQRPVARPPLLRVPEPPSMTRLHPAAGRAVSQL
ncbi:MAG: hypothetical protein JWP97_5784 [Labilithrix sp.]|nr:hypothetical protein [Labilithrix sp.]